ncbi:ankyrin repeat-containing domain protein [Bisporella sp. PMI_857]|nr:ankyrin repeat-containing domain protein [Bisporella sp. PMI_857]
MCRNVERILSYAQQPGTSLGPLGEKEASRNKDHAVSAKCHTESGESLKSAPFQDNAFKVETAVFHQRCATQCRCQCHRVTRMQTPPWLKDIFGGLFVTTRGIRLLPFPGRETCNESSCYRHSNTVARIDYYFPCWLMACMISIVGQGHALIGAGATLSLKASRMVPDYSPIFFAVDHANHKSIAHMVYSGSATLFDMDQYGDSLLWYASRSHNWQTCTMLTQAGLSWSSTNLSGLLTNRSPAHEAWMQLYMLESETPETEHMKMILKRDDSYDHLKLPALHSVVLKQTSKVDLDDYLQLNHSEINIRDEWGNTPLTWAAQRQDERAVGLLLKWGADPNVNDMKGNSALQIAAFNRSFESVKQLLRANANIHNRNNWKNTPLHRAAKSAESCTDIIELLLEKGVENQDSGNEWGHTPLHEAALSGHAENVRLLCSRNFNVNARSADGQTPIFKAMLQNQIEVVRILISAGADLDIFDKSGRHLIEQACLFGTLELLKFVLPAIISSMDPSTAEEYKQKGWKCIEKDRDHTCFVDRCKAEEFATLKSLFLDKDPPDGEDDLAQSFYADALETLP